MTIDTTILTHAFGHRLRWLFCFPVGLQISLVLTHKWPAILVVKESYYPHSCHQWNFYISPLVQVHVLAVVAKIFRHLLKGIAAKLIENLAIVSRFNCRILDEAGDYCQSNVDISDVFWSLQPTTHSGNFTQRTGKSPSLIGKST